MLMCCRSVICSWFFCFKKPLKNPFIKKRVHLYSYKTKPIYELGRSYIGFEEKVWRIYTTKDGHVKWTIFCWLCVRGRPAAEPWGTGQREGEG